MFLTAVVAEGRRGRLDFRGSAVPTKAVFFTTEVTEKGWLGVKSSSFRGGNFHH
jgi:hypothetical protein